MNDSSEVKTIKKVGVSKIKKKILLIKTRLKNERANRIKSQIFDF